MSSEAFPFTSSPPALRYQWQPLRSPEERAKRQGLLRAMGMGTGTQPPAAGRERGLPIASLHHIQLQSAAEPSTGFISS